MDIASVGSLSTALSASKDGDAVGTLVLKKALRIQEETAQQLIQAAAQSTPTAPASNPPNLGRSVDVRV